MVTPAEPKRWSKTHIDSWWGNMHRELPYVNEPFNDTESVALWKSLGYTQTRFTGNMYDMRNPEPTWMAKFYQHFHYLENVGWSVYQMPPGSTLPNHSDTYNRYREIHNITDPSTIYRAIVFLEDWQSGHYSEIDGNAVVNWSAGDILLWQNDVPHLAANVGMTDRYTLQLTGTCNENILLQ